MSNSEHSSVGEDWQSPETKIEAVGVANSGSPDSSLLSCECHSWARTGNDMLLFLSHHPRCPKSSVLIDVRVLLDNLINGIEAWASDEDGVHPDCWKAYRDACAATMRLSVCAEAD